MTEIPNLVADGITDEMTAETNAKFELWGKAIKEEWIDGGIRTQQREAYQLLRDPTLFAYAFFKDQNQKPLKFFPYQDMILNDILIKKKSDRYLFVAANQIGKSFALCYMALFYALNNVGKTVLMTSKTLVQAKDLLRQIKNLMRNSSLDFSYDTADTDTKTELYFKHYSEKFNEKGEPIRLNDSRIIVVPATEAALGYSVDLALTDEIAFYDDSEHFYMQILQPRTYATKGTIVMFSNPNGQMGLYWDLWSKNKRYRKYRFNFLDNPRNTQKEFDQLAEEMPQEKIDSTLLAIFTNAEGGFLTLNERKAMFEERSNSLPVVFTQPVTIAFDFAKSRDRTVRMIGIPTNFEGKKGVYIYEIKEYPSGTEYTEILRELQELIDDYGAKNIDMVAFDASGVGKALEEFMKIMGRIGVSIKPVDFTLQSKSRMYTSLKLLAERNVSGMRSLKMPEHSSANKQFSMLRFKKTNRDYLQVHHEKESDRDDIPDCCALLCDTLLGFDNIPVTLTIIGGDSDVSNKEEKLPIRIDLNRHSCGNLIDDGDEICSFCFEKLY